MISIIVPVYNVEKYIHQCINSIINQTFKNIEIILVNDGSTDSSGLICDEFATKDTRIKVIQKKNGGLSSARNSGLKIATGEYVWFIDSDDWIRENSLELVSKTLTSENLEMLGFSCTDYIDSENKYLEPKNIREINTCDGVAYLKSDINMIPVAWLYIYSLEFLNKYNIAFKEKIIHEDDYFNLICFSFVKKIKKIPNALYYYRIRSNSIQTSPISKIKIESLFELINLCKDLRNSNLNAYFIENKIYNYITSLIESLIKFDVSKKEKEQIAKKVKQLIPKQKIFKKDAKGIKFFKLIYNINFRLYYFLKNKEFKNINY